MCHIEEKQHDCHSLSSCSLVSVQSMIRQVAQSVERRTIVVEARSSRPMEAIWCWDRVPPLFFASVLYVAPFNLTKSSLDLVFFVPLALFPVYDAFVCLFIWFLNVLINY